MSLHNSTSFSSSHLPVSLNSTLLFTLPPLSTLTSVSHHPRRRHRKNLVQRLLSFSLNSVPSSPPRVSPSLEEDFGDPLGAKAEGHVRLAYSNIDGFPPYAANNPKANSLRRVIRSLEIDFFAGVESNLNWQQMPREGRLPEWFRSENALRTVASYNTHENFGRRQHGGTFELAFGELAQRVIDTGTDSRGLGRYSWMLLRGRSGHRARLITIYVPCKSSRFGQSTVMAQHRRHFAPQGLSHLCPRQILLDDLRLLLCGWRQQGERLLVFIDANEDVRKGPFQSLFTGPGLHMQDLTLLKHGSLPTTHRRGCLPIDACFATPDVTADSATFRAFFSSPGDHRMGVWDIRTSVLVGDDVHRIVRPPARRLACSVPKSVSRYTALLETHLKRHRVLPKLHALYLSQSGPLTHTQSAGLESIDRVVSEGMLYAEKRCRKLAMGDIAYSPAVAKARRRRFLFKRILDLRNGSRQVKASWIRREAHSLNILNPLCVTLAQAQHNFDTADKEWALLKKRDPDSLRRDFLHDRAANTTGQYSSAAQRAAQQIIHRERTREDFRRIRYAIGSSRGGAVQQVEVLEDGVYVEKTDQAEVEAALMDMVAQRFRLTEQTPFMQDPLLSSLGHLGLTATAQDILSGTYECPEEVDEYTKTFLTSLQFPSHPHMIPDISCEITKQDFQQYWRKAKERTSSSLSGLHFGHYKAAAHSDYLSELQAVKTQLAVTGYSPLTRWRTSLVCMLEKVEGVIVVDKLRAILLLEADFNFSNGLIFSKRMMHQAETQQWIPDECYGSRKNCEAIEVALNRGFVWDITRQRRAPAAIVSVDAQTCYDRIQHSAGSLSARRWSVPPCAIYSMLSTIQRMVFHLRTGFGDSSGSFGGLDPTSVHPFQGGCQGNRGAPALWFCLSVVLVRMLHSLGFVSTFRSAMSSASLSLSGFLFVDDTDLLAVASDHSVLPATIIARLQSTVNAWYGGLHASGGALKPEKCSWGLASFYWDRYGKWHYATTVSQPGHISIAQTLDGSRIPIHRHSPSEAIRAIGVWQAMDGSMTGQLTALCTAVNTYCDKILTGYLPRHLFRTGFDSVISASIRYSLPATTFSLAQAVSITKPLYSLLLPRLGAVRTFPGVFRYAPLSLQGLNLPHLYVEQGIAQLRQVLTHGAISSVTGKLFRVSLELAQLEVGLGSSLFSVSFQHFGFLLSQCWIKSLWEFLSTYQISLSWPDQVLPKPQRTGDSFLMDLFVSSNIFDRPTLISCNRCRLALAAVTWADIVTGDGHRIRADAWSVRPDFLEPSSWEFPLERPSPADTERWRRVLSHFAPQLNLPTLDYLGSWITPPHRIWQWFYDPHRQQLFRWFHGVWHRYLPDSTRLLRYRAFRFFDIGTAPPARAHRATATIDAHSRARFEGSSAIRHAVPPTYTSLLQLANSLNVPPLTASQLRLSHSHASLLFAIRDGTAMGCTDGSYMPKLSEAVGAAAWRIECPATSESLQGWTQTTGIESEVDSYRSELHGLHSLLTGLEALCSFFQLTEGAVTIGCDNKTAIYRSSGAWLKVSQSTPHVDLVRAIRLTIHKLPIRVTFQHVYGHQDDRVPAHSLPRMAQLNISMDLHAKRRLQWIHNHSEHSSQRPIRNEGWLCHVDGVKVTSDPGPAIRHSIFGREMVRKLEPKGRLSNTAYSLIDWPAIASMMSAAPTLYRLWVTKHVSGFFSHGSNMHRWKFWPNSACPCCTAPREDKIHLLTCPAELGVANWTAAVDRFHLWLISVDTSPDIISCFTTALLSRDPAHTFPVAGTSPLVVQAGAAQVTIGWVNFTDGKIARAWRDIQKSYYHSISSRRMTRTWATGVVHQLLMVTHSQWTHRNSILHQRDTSGRVLRDTQDLHAAVQAQFNMGVDGLHPDDHHLLTRGLNAVLTLSLSDGRAWLSGIRIARETYEASEARSISSMQQIMANWLQTCQ
jgi:hypothetical protein